MHIAVIPARSGSKGLKDKNIKPLAGIPLIAHTINAAIKSGIFDVVFVSTDSEEYAEIAREYGADVPFLRDERLATDTSGSWPVVKEAVDRFRDMGKKFGMATLLQPTSPLRTVEDIISAHKIFADNNAKAVVSVCKTDHSPLWCNTLPHDNSLEGFIPATALNKPRQELPIYYRLNGAIYIIDIARMDLNSVDLYQSGCYAYVMPKVRSVDIDDEVDFMLAEAVSNTGQTE